MACTVAVRKDDRACTACCAQLAHLLKSSQDHLTAENKHAKDMTSLDLVKPMIVLSPRFGRKGSAASCCRQCRRRCHNCRGLSWLLRMHFRDSQTKPRAQHTRTACDMLYSSGAGWAAASMLWGGAESECLYANQAVVSRMPRSMFISTSPSLGWHYLSHGVVTADHILELPPAISVHLQHHNLHIIGLTHHDSHLRQIFPSRSSAVTTHIPVARASRTKRNGGMRWSRQSMIDCSWLFRTSSAAANTRKSPDRPGLTDLLVAARCIP